MILFLNDWKKYPTAKPHFATRNRSALKISTIFKRMGVRNHLFPLALIDQSLVGVDPHDPAVMNDPDLVLRIVTECKLNFWYFAREVYKTKPPGSNELVHIEFNRLSIAMWWSFHNHLTSIVMSLRQVGKNFNTRVLLRYLLNLGTINTKMLFVSKDDDLRLDEMETIKNTELGLPPYLQYGEKTRSKAPERIYTPHPINNVLMSAIPQPSVTAAKKLARGKTIPIIIFDEAAFSTNIHISLNSALPATTKARKIAKANGTAYGTMLLTTAGDLSTKEGAYIHTLYEGCTTFTESLYDVGNPSLLEQIIIKNNPEGNYRVKIKYNHKQLGITDNELKRIISDAMNTDPDSINMEYLLNWISAGGRSPIPKNIIKVLNDSSRPPVFELISPQGYILYSYLTRSELRRRVKNNIKFVVGIDTSEASGSDAIYVIFRDSKNGEVVLSGTYNETNTFVIAKYFYWLMNVFKDALFIIERKSTGVTILDALVDFCVKDGVNPFTRLFNWYVNDLKSSEINSFLNIQGSELRELVDKNHKLFGYQTSRSGRNARTNLYNELVNALKLTGTVSNDDTLIGQLLKLKIIKNRIDHGPKGHDDAVIAWLLSYYVLVYGKNLEVYNLDGRTILSHVVSVMMKSKGEDHNYTMIMQKELRARIDSLVEQLKRTKDEVLAYKIYNKLVFLSKDIDDRYVPSLNINSLTEEISILKKVGY